jgi:hypothetical protein
MSLQCDPTPWAIVDHDKTPEINVNPISVQRQADGRRAGLKIRLADHITMLMAAARPKGLANVDRFCGRDIPRPQACPIQFPASALPYLLPELACE